MSLTLRQSTRFRRDVKRLRRQVAELSQLEIVVATLVAQESLDKRYRDHALVGNWRGFRECYIQTDFA